MNAPVTVTSERPMVLRQLPITAEKNLPMVLPQTRTADELDTAVKTNALIALASGGAGAGGLVTSGWLVTKAVELGLPLIQNVATLNFADPTTALAAAGAVTAGALASFGTYNGVKLLINGANAAIRLGDTRPVPPGKEPEEIAHAQAGWRLKLRGFATEALGALGAGAAATGLFFLQSPASFVAGAAGVAALIAGFFVGKQTAAPALAWAGKQQRAEQQFLIAQNIEAALKSGTITQAEIEAPTPDEQPAARG